MSEKDFSAEDLLNEIDEEAELEENNIEDDEVVEEGNVTPEATVSLEDYRLLEEKYNLVLQRNAELERDKNVSDATPVGMTHIVKKGDNVRALAKKYGTTVTKIARLNDGNVRYLVPGKELRIK
jgi:transcription elongation GreA/GreB family factor